jgi:hypothetical protein
VQVYESLKAEFIAKTFFNAKGAKETPQRSQREVMIFKNILLNKLGLFYQ